MWPWRICFTSQRLNILGCKIASFDIFLLGLKETSQVKYPAQGWCSRCSVNASNFSLCQCQLASISKQRPPPPFPLSVLLSRRILQRQVWKLTIWKLTPGPYSRRHPMRCSESPRCPRFEGETGGSSLVISWLGFGSFTPVTWVQFLC